MKKRGIISLILSVSMFFCILPTTMAAAMDEVTITTDSGMFTTNCSFGSSSLTGYNNTPSVYDANIDDASATFRPMLINGGKYKIEFYNIQHTGNTTGAALDIYINGELNNTYEFDHRNTESGMIDLGTYPIDAGDNSYVVIRKVVADGFIRPNAVKFTLIEYDENAKSVVEINEEPYSDFGTRTLSTREVTLPAVSENKIYVQSGASGNGTMNSPYGTIYEAQKRLTDMFNAGELKNGATVVLRGGTYFLDNTLELKDYGGAPITYMAYEGEKVTLTAGKTIAPELFSKVSDEKVLQKIPTEGKNKVYVAELSDVGIFDIADMNLRTGTAYILVIGEKKGILSRWPNEGYGATGEIIDTAARSDSGPRKKGFTYEISDARQLRWSDAKSGWLNGYWMTPYTIDYSSIAYIDTDKMRIVGKDWNGLGNYGHARFFAENLLEEIDKEGEWYLDTASNKLYVYPFDEVLDTDVKFAATSFPIVKFVGAKNTVMRGIDVEVGGSDGVIIDSNSENCMFAGGEIKFVSGVGANINGKKNFLRDCDISYVGAQGTIVSGGDPVNLISAGNVVENNEVHNTGTGGGTKHGIVIQGCGNRVANNHVYNIPTHGISGGGMEQTIEYNIVERTNMEMGDTGGVYFNNYGLGYGTVFRYNIIKDSVGMMPKEGFNGEGALGLYMDDLTSGVELYGNIVYNAKEPGTFIHGGRYNKIYNNMYINCDIPIRVNKTSIGKGTAVGGSIWTNLENFNVKDGPIGVKYPAAKANFEDRFGDPINNTVENNISFNSGNSDFEKTLDLYDGKHSGNVSFEGLPDCNMNDFSNIDYINIQQECPDFEPIPVEQIGTYTGGLRTSTESLVYDNRADEFSATYPANGATDISPDITLKWERGIGGIRSYDVYIATDPEFRHIIDYVNTTEGEATINLEYGKTYYWRVSATPMLGYDKRWNSNGVMNFTTINAVDMLYGEYLSAKALLNNSEEGEAGGKYPYGSKEELSVVMNETLSALNSGDDALMLEAKDKLVSAKEEFMKKRIGKTDDLQILIYDDFENDTIGERPAGLFFRSYQMLNVAVAQDLKNPMNKVFMVRDEEATSMYGNRFFDPQEDYVELYASVYAEQTTGSMSFGLYQTGKYTTETGTTSSCAARVVFASDSYIYDGTARNTKLMKYSPHEWYDIKIKLHLKEKCYDIYINGDLVKKNASLDSSAVKSVNQFIFDTTDGNSSTATNRGGFMLDNIIVRAQKNEGENPYLTSLKINGKEVYGFEPGKSVYNVDIKKDEIANANIEYTHGKNADVKIWKGENGLYITVIAGNRKSAFTYYLRAAE